jgi:copper chaperone CopZ
MKKILFFTLVTILSFTANAQITSVHLQASGLTCSMCNLSIKKSLEKLPFVASIKPNVEKATYDISFKTGADVSLAEIQQAVVKAGFSVAKLKFTVNAASATNVSSNGFELNGFSYNLVDAELSNIATEQTFMVTDKGFLSDKEFKKFKLKNKALGVAKAFNITKA